MHARLYNEAIFSLHLRPRSPLLIKAGRSGQEALDPTLPDMSFVRTTRRNQTGNLEEEVFIPGSSLRGVVRSHAEKLLRSVEQTLACDPTQTGSKQRFPSDCISTTSSDRDEDTRESNQKDADGPTAYNGSCYACKLFGNTAIASRVRMSDMYLAAESNPLLDIRYGVAIDRITGAVAHGPFEIEILTDAMFEGTITLRNFTLGQFGLLAGTLLDLGDGLVPIGYGKSRGLGRIEFTFNKLTVRTLRKPENSLLGVGHLAVASDRAYHLPQATEERLPLAGGTSKRKRGFYLLEAEGETASQWLEEASNRWVKETYQ